MPTTTVSRPTVTREANRDRAAALLAAVAAYYRAQDTRRRADAIPYTLTEAAR